ncbi:MAG: recombination mediator RecR [Dehalococcoidia bacterium]|nr:recombination mediator RecR [Dehalococcoidia bacterium]
MNSFSGVPEPLTRLINELSKLPGIGPKSAQRLAFHLLRSSEETTKALVIAVEDMKKQVDLCSICFHITDKDPCQLCQDEERDESVLCVVEQALDVIVLERTGQYRGRYHVLQGVLNPMEGIGPEDLRISELLQRVQSGNIGEVIMATNPSLEGESTAMYVQRLLTPHGVRITRLARGLPSGADLEYTDEITLAHAFEGRQTF